MKMYSKKLASLFTALALGVLLASSSVFAAEPQIDPDARLKEARALVEQGKQEEALQQFIWCYDHGVEVNSKFARTRDTRVTLFMVSLGKKYPPARVALVERRNALAGKVKTAPKDASEDVLRQLGYLDLAISDDAAILETLALFSAGKPNYKAYGLVMEDRLIEKKYYKEVVAIGDVNEAIEILEKTVRNVDKMRQSGKLDEKGEAKLKANAIKAASGVEMYAGVGDLKHAKQVADLLLGISDASEVRQAIAERLRRAGAEELAAKYESQKK